MSANDKNTVNNRPKRANAGKNPNLQDFSVFGLAKQPTEKTINAKKEIKRRLEGPNKETCPIKRRNLAMKEFPIEETVMVPNGQFGHPDDYFETDSDATTEMSDSDDSVSTQSDPMEGIEPAEGTTSDDKRNFQCDMCEMHFIEEDIHEERNITLRLHLLCHACFRNYDGLQKSREAYEKHIEREKAMEEIVWPEDAQVFSRNPAHFDMTQPQYPEKSICSAIIDLTIAGPIPDSGAFWRYESDSNLIVID